MQTPTAIRSGAEIRQKTPGYAWVILAVVFLAGVAGPLNLFKVPPVMPVLIDAFHMDIASAAWLMSIFSVTGFILAIPAGFIMQRFGPKAIAAISHTAERFLPGEIRFRQGRDDLMEGIRVGSRFRDEDPSRYFTNGQEIGLRT